MPPRTYEFNHQGSLESFLQGAAGAYDLVDAIRARHKAGRQADEDRVRKQEAEDFEQQEWLRSNGYDPSIMYDGSPTPPTDPGYRPPVDPGMTPQGPGSAIPQVDPGFTPPFNPNAPDPRRPGSGGGGGLRDAIRKALGFGQQQGAQRPVRRGARLTRVGPSDAERAAQEKADLERELRREQDAAAYERERYQSDTQYGMNREDNDAAMARARLEQQNANYRARLDASTQRNTSRSQEFQQVSTVVRQYETQLDDARRIAATPASKLAVNFMGQTGPNGEGPLQLAQQAVMEARNSIPRLEAERDRWTQRQRQLASEEGSGAAPDADGVDARLQAAHKKYQKALSLGVDPTAAAEAYRQTIQQITNPR